MTIPLKQFFGRANYQLKYVGQNHYNVPALLTQEAADKFCADKTALKVKITSNSFMPLVPGKPSIKELELDLV